MVAFTISEIFYYKAKQDGAILVLIFECSYDSVDGL